MTDYGRGDILGVATMLPATSAGVFLFTNYNIHPLIVLGFIIVGSVSTFISISYILRYLKNRAK